MGKSKKEGEHFIKCHVTLPPELLKKVDNLAMRLMESRAVAIRQMIREYQEF